VTYSVQSGIFRPSQSSRLLTIAAAVASGKPLTSILTAAPSSGQLTRAHMRSVMSVYSISCCPVRPKAARNGAADVWLRDVVPDVQAGCCPTYLANSAVGSRPQGRTPEDPGPSVAICALTVIPELSAWDRHCPAAWQQSWRNCLDPRPLINSRAFNHAPPVQRITRASSLCVSALLGAPTTRLRRPLCRLIR